MVFERRFNQKRDSLYCIFICVAIKLVRWLLFLIFIIKATVICFHSSLDDGDRFGHCFQKYITLKKDIDHFFFRSNTNGSVVGWVSSKSSSSSL